MKWTKKVKNLPRLWNNAVGMTMLWLIIARYFYPYYLVGRLCRRDWVIHRRQPCSLETWSKFSLEYGQRFLNSLKPPIKYSINFFLFISNQRATSITYFPAFAFQIDFRPQTHLRLAIPAIISSREAEKFTHLIALRLHLDDSSIRA